MSQLFEAKLWDLAKLLMYTNPTLVNQRGKSSSVPLHTAAYDGHLIAADLLLQYGADATITLNQPRSQHHHATALDIALMRQQYKVATLLMQHGAPANYAYQKLEQRLLSQLIEDNHIELVRLLVYVNRSLVHQPDNKGYYPLQLTALLGRTAIARCLIDYGAAIRYNSPFKTTNQETAAVLKQIGATVELTEDWEIIEAADCPPAASITTTVASTQRPTYRPTQHVVNNTLSSHVWSLT